MSRSIYIPEYIIQEYLDLCTRDFSERFDENNLIPEAQDILREINSLKALNSLIEDRAKDYYVINKKNDAVCKLVYHIKVDENETIFDECIKKFPHIKSELVKKTTKKFYEQQPVEAQFVLGATNESD